MINKKFIYLVLLASVSLFVMSCGGGEKKTETTESHSTTKPKAKSMVKAKADPMKNMGIGPIKELTLPSEIDQALVTKGEEVYKAKCTACHKAEKKFIGPAPKGIMTRRSPAWIMNMILNPEEMVKKDPIAKELLAKFSAPMANQNLTEEEARSIVEYFRTL